MKYDWSAATNDYTASAKEIEMVRSPGIEPGYQASQAWTLSVVLRARQILRHAILSIFSLLIPEKFFQAALDCYD